MSVLEKTFENIKAQGRKALIPYIMAGDPDLKVSADLLKSLPEAGADVIELGMPFTDPMADGPVIQNAARRALANKVGMADVLDLIREFRKDNTQTPIILMGYFNPLMAYGVERFCQDASQAGVNGLLIVDIPPEESAELWPYARKAGLDIIRMITPTTKDKRLDTVLKETSGFLYYVSITGITGTASAMPDKIASHIDQIRGKTNLATVVGFGIKTADDARAMGAVSDGVVVGSALIKALEDSGIESVLKILRDLKAALDNISDTALPDADVACR